jgi:protein-S-isoprenylcysteine O-methyltransferase Ste14
VRRLLELRVPPLLLTLIAGSLMWWLARVTPALDWPLGSRAVAATLLCISGLAIAIAAVREFRVARTTVNPLRPAGASAMVRTGIYGRTRNPMYLGLLLVLAAWSVWLASPAAMAVLPIVVVYLDRLQIAPEERALAERFGRDFDEYRRSVRRWL